MSDLEKKLLEVKDSSELMIDLAYSSLLYDNKDIAEEVLAMEEAVDELATSVQQDAIRDALEDKDVSKAFVTVRLVQSLEEIADAASQIAGVVLGDVAPHPVIGMSIRESDVIISTAEVGPGSDLANRTLGATKLASECGMWVIAIRRDRKYIYGPDEKTVVLPGDRLIARGPQEGEAHFKGFASGSEHAKCE